MTGEYRPFISEQGRNRFTCSNARRHQTIYLIRFGYVDGETEPRPITSEDIEMRHYPAKGGWPTVKPVQPGPDRHVETITAEGERAWEMTCPRCKREYPLTATQYALTRDRLGPDWTVDVSLQV